jgi:small-conductance mechanosensitive channel
VLVAFWVARAVRFLLREEVLPNMSLPRGVDNSIASLSYYALLMLGLLLALAAAGFQVGQLALVFGALGVGIGLGLQDVVKNFVSGLILMFERPMKPGDVVEITGTSGHVRDIGMRATTIRTFEGADVVVPNGTLLSEKLANWTLLDMHRRIELNVGVAYGSDPEQVRALLLPVVQSLPGVASEPAPNVLFSGFGASSLDFSIRAWTHDENWVETRSMLAMRVYSALRQAGIEIPFAQRDLHLRSMSEEVAAALARRDAPPPASAPEPGAVPQEP